MSGLLSVQELRTLVTRIYPLPTSAANWQLFEDMLFNCSKTQTPMEPLGVGVGPDGKEVCQNCTFYDIIIIASLVNQVWITEQLMASCPALLKLMEARANTRRRYQHEKQDESNVAFKMIRDDVAKVQSDYWSLMFDDIASCLRRSGSWMKFGAIPRNLYA